ncbi:hypothetical protein QTO34_011537 [Cnephaeus nilssonii]|uniref:Uncharacterized protein n=1 Tax=Cnephaeus nilssonii TaxID=3371016 RepID=A0AA40LF72_CNENI|nr:hypothetical protein QTO34_011537 [Eptesicus nilssonii]
MQSGQLLGQIALLSRCPDRAKWHEQGHRCDNMMYLPDVVITRLSDKTDGGLIAVLVLTLALPWLAPVSKCRHIRESKLNMFLEPLVASHLDVLVQLLLASVLRAAWF